MLLAAGALLLVAPLALQPTSAPLVPRSVRRTCLAATAGTLDATAEALDRRAFLAAHAGDAAKAEAAHLSKAEWVRENGATCGVDIAPFLRSNSFLAALEGCEIFRVSDKRGMRLTDAWTADQKAVVAFGRSFG